MGKKQDLTSSEKDEIVCLLEKGIHLQDRVAKELKRLIDPDISKGETESQTVAS